MGDMARLACEAWSTSNDVWLAESKYRPSPKELYELMRVYSPSVMPICECIPSFHTASLLPGSFTVVYCSSLYF